MEPLTATATWMLSEAGKQLYHETLSSLFLSMGFALHEQKQSETRLRYEFDKTNALIEAYVEKLNTNIKEIKNVLEENRLAELHTGLKLLVDASHIDNRDVFLAQALSSFYRISSLPVDGVTGQFTNQQLRSLALLGIACVFSLLTKSPDVIARNIVSAVDADPLFCEQFLGEKCTKSIARELGIIFYEGDKVRLKEGALFNSVEFSRFTVIKTEPDAPPPYSNSIVIPEETLRKNESFVRCNNLLVLSSSYSKTSVVTEAFDIWWGSRGWPTGLPYRFQVCVWCIIETSCLYRVMKRDLDLIRKILLTIEEFPQGGDTPINLLANDGEQCFKTSLTTYLHCILPQK